MRLVVVLWIVAACGGAEAPVAPPEVEVVAPAPSDAPGPETVGAATDPDIRVPMSGVPSRKYTGAPELDPRRGPPVAVPEEAQAEPSDGFSFDKTKGYKFEDAEGFTFDDDLPPVPKGLIRMEPVDGEPY